ncbi:MAG: hypothetical protein J0L75_05410 [Spirochaetes bacterium]|nr:hypothetical protein [Spirochaetota bacterium]
MAPKQIRQGILFGSLLVSGSLPLVGVAATLWAVGIQAPSFGPISFWTALCLMAALEASLGFLVASWMIRKACAVNGDDYGELMRAFIVSFPLPLMWATRYNKEWEVRGG